MTETAKPPTAAPPPTRVQLADMDLRIGQPVQLVIEATQTYKYYTRLIGYVEPDFIMLRVPMENGWAVPLQAGQSLQVRVFSGVSIFDFDSRIQTVLLHPRNFMLLDCPAHIRQTRLRSHERVKCALPVKVLRTGSGASVAADGLCQDLSAGGAAVVTPEPLGAVGDTLLLDLAFSLQTTGTQEHLQIEATLQSVQPLRNAQGQDSGHHHGLRFSRIEPLIALLVNELHKPRTLA